MTSCASFFSFNHSGCQHLFRTDVPLKKRYVIKISIMINSKVAWGIGGKRRRPTNPEPRNNCSTYPRCLSFWQSSRVLLFCQFLQILLGARHLCLLLTLFLFLDGQLFLCAPPSWRLMFENKAQHRASPCIVLFFLCASEMNEMTAVYYSSCVLLKHLLTLAFKGPWIWITT